MSSLHGNNFHVSPFFKIRNIYVSIFKAKQYVLQIFLCLRIIFVIIPFFWWVSTSNDNTCVAIHLSVSDQSQASNYLHTDNSVSFLLTEINVLLLHKNLALDVLGRAQYVPHGVISQKSFITAHTSLLFKHYIR